MACTNEHGRSTYLGRQRNFANRTAMVSVLLEATNQTYHKKRHLRSVHVAVLAFWVKGCGAFHRLRAYNAKGPITPSNIITN